MRAGVLIAMLAFGSGRALLAQADGTQHWRFPVQGWISFSSPAVSPDGANIYIGVERLNSGHVLALGPAGELRWQFETSGRIDASPAVGADGTVYIGSVNGRFYALDPRLPNSVPQEQRIKWQFNAFGYISSSPAIGRDGTIYFGDGDGELNAVSAQGELRWSFPTGGAIVSGVAIGDDGTIHFGSLDRNLYAVRPDGSLRWSFATGGVIFGSPAIGRDGTIYVGSYDQRLYAIAPDGTLRWSYFTNGVIDASPVIGADGTIYVLSTDGNVYAVNPGESQERIKWMQEIHTTTASTPAVRADGTIIFGADDNVVRALNPEDGSLRWDFEPGQPEKDDYIMSSPIVAPDGSIYVGSLDGHLYKLHGNGSPLSTVSSWPAFQRNAQRQALAEKLNRAGRLVNLSTRAQVEADKQLIVGFVVQSTGTRAVLVRAVGPTLANFGVEGFMPDPRLQVYVGSTALEGAANDDWGLEGSSFFKPGATLDATRALEAFPLPEGSKDAALVVALNGGVYSVLASSADNRGGVVLVEAYDALGGDEARLVNLSTRHMAGNGENVLITGFVVGGTEPTRLLLRGIGPGLAQFGVPGVLARPRLQLYSASGQPLGRPNEGWSSGGMTYDLAAMAASVGAFSLPPGSADAAMVVVVQPGPYTLRVSGVGDTTGEALAEIYVLP